MPELPHLEARLTDGSVPPVVRAILRGAIEVATADGIRVVDDRSEDSVSIKAAGKPAAVYVGAARLSIALDPDRAQKIVNAHPSLVIAKDSAVTWYVRGPYAAVTALRPEYLVGTWIVEALRRSARNVRSGPTVKTRTPRAPKTAPKPAPVVIELPRCPVPGCNLVMVGGSCGFHD